jgi:hypothetical protein
LGSLPDGLYQFTDNALTIFSTWPVERLRSLETALRAVRAAPDPRTAVEAVLKDEPDLADLAHKLSSLSNPQTIIGFVTMLLTAIMLLISQSGTTINTQTVIENVTKPPTQVKQATVSIKKVPPPPPRRKNPKGHRKRRK